MSLLSTLLLAILQAITEWLPVSSEGQTLYVAVNFLGMTPWDTFRIVIMLHLGTSLSVFAKYRKEYVDALTKDKKMFNFLFFSTIGTAIVAVPLYFALKEIFLSVPASILTILIGIFLIVTGFLLRTSRNIVKFMKREDVTIKEALLAGIVQGFAILPGISRSGITTSYFLLRKYDKEESFNLSFLMSVPVVLGLFVLDIVTTADLTISLEIILAVLVTAIIGYFMIEFFLEIARKFSFSGVCFFFGGIMILLTFIQYAVT